MDNKIKNFYELIPQEKIPDDKFFKNHFILPNSLIALIGGTGTGKTQFLLNFLDRVGPKFSEIIIYTTDVEEKLLKLLKKSIPETVITNNINDIPDLKDFENTKNIEKLIVFDDFITLTGKDLKKIEEYSISGRKYGFTMIFMVQNYKQLDKTIRRNLNYLALFRLNDNSTLKNIIQNHNIHDIDKEVFKRAYLSSTKDKFNFLLIDLKGDKKYTLRHNFLGFFKV